MQLPGMTVSHQIIREACRTNRGASGAFEEAIARIREQYSQLIRQGVTPDTEMHLLLVVQKDRHRVEKKPEVERE